MDGGQAMDRRTFMVLVSGGLFTAPLTAEAQRVLRLVSEPVAFHTRDVDYLQVDGKTFHATVYQPEGSGPFPAFSTCTAERGSARTSVRRKNASVGYPHPPTI